MYVRYRKPLTGPYYNFQFIWRQCTRALLTWLHNPYIWLTLLQEIAPICLILSAISQLVQALQAFCTTDKFSGHCVCHTTFCKMKTAWQILYFIWAVHAIAAFYGNLIHTHKSRVLRDGFCESSCRDVLIPVTWLFCRYNSFSSMNKKTYTV